MGKKERVKTHHRVERGGVIYMERIDTSDKRPAAIQERIARTVAKAKADAATGFISRSKYAQDAIDKADVAKRLKALEEKE